MSLDNLPTNRPLVLDDFQDLTPGQEIQLYYHLYSQGSLWWRHGRVEGELLWGQIRHNENNPWSEPGEEYLFEFDDFVCWGEGVEPVWATLPPTPKEDFILLIGEEEEFGDDEEWEDEEDWADEEEEE
jgi:hypothetical protein